jgi:hypothetical protein
LHPRGVFVQAGINDLLSGHSEAGIAPAVRRITQLYSDAGSKVFATSIFPVARGYGPPGLNDGIVRANQSVASILPKTAVFIDVHSKLVK